MLNSEGFDIWAGDYDESVRDSERGNTYPFAGYGEVLREIRQRVLEKTAPEVLDIGFGTGTLTAELYRRGCRIWGLDFSPRMIELAREKMPEAQFLEWDFTNGLPASLQTRKFDSIVATYSLHHLTDEGKIPFLRLLLSLLKEDGKLLIGDVAFKSRRELEACKEANASAWDTGEWYFVYEEIEPFFPGKIQFLKVFSCAGILILENK